MHTIDAIKNMTDEEVAAENTRLARKLIVKNIVLPMVTVVVVHLTVNYLVKKLAKNDDNA